MNVTQPVPVAPSPDPVSKILKVLGGMGIGLASVYGGINWVTTQWLEEKAELRDKPYRERVDREFRRLGHTDAVLADYMLESTGYTHDLLGRLAAAQGVSVDRPQSLDDVTKRVREIRRNGGTQ